MTKDLNNNKEESKEIIFSQTNDLLNKNQDENESINYNFLSHQKTCFKIGINIFYNH